MSYLNLKKNVQLLELRFNLLINLLKIYLPVQTS